MVVVHTGLCNDEVGLLVVEVHHSGLGSIQAATAHASHAASATEAAHATEPTAAAAAHAHVVGIVGIEHTHDAVVVTHIHTKETTGIAVFCTGTQVGVHDGTTVHSGADTEVEHRLLVAVVYTCDTGQVALLVICAYLFYNISGQVLQRCLRIAEFLAVHFDL